MISFLNTAILAANASIEGTVKDVKTGEPLFGANIVLLGTSLGGTTDIDGNYKIASVTPGNYTIKISYVGYKDQQEKIKIKDGAHERKDFALEAISVEGQEVIVTAQAIGQTQAINQQLSSDQIINAVSAEKIQELPDANAAESVGRLPGVSLVRSGGEGNEVIVRGMAPQFNQITINGIEMGSSNPNDRSTDLSMISSTMLEGIEVSKTVTADMDANVIGGVVNFTMREAKTKEPGVPLYHLDIQGGYKSLSDAYNKYNNYKYVFSFENRFLDEQLGVFAQVDIGRKNLTSNEMSAGFSTDWRHNFTDYTISTVQLADIPRDRSRYNGALNLDYTHSTGKIKLVNFFSTGTTNTQTRFESYDVGGSMLYYNLTNAKDIISSVSNSLDISQDISSFNLDFKLANTYSENKSPDGWNVEFSQASPGLIQVNLTPNKNPVSVTNAAVHNLDQAVLMYLDDTYSLSKARTFSTSLDLKTDVTLPADISATLKIGGSFKYENRSYALDEYDSPLLLNSAGGASITRDLIKSGLSLPANNSDKIGISPFLDPGFSYGEFLNGDYQMYAPLNYGMLSKMIQIMKNNIDLIAKNNEQGSYSHDNYQSTIHNYNGHESHGAFYGMAIIKVGPQITVIPGLRYQDFQTVYTGVAGVTSPESYQVYTHSDTTVTRNHAYLLPDVTIKYKPLSWFDLRLSYTNTLSYPSFSDFVPRVDMTGTTVGWNNYNLVPAKSANFDVYFSFYDNAVGLFTVGGYLKQIKNMVYSWSFNVMGPDAKQYLPSCLTGFNPKTTYAVSTLENDPYTNKVYGMELDWQTHFWYLPGVLSGLVFNANYTHTFSKTQYPYEYTKTSANGRSSVTIDTSFTDKLLYQPDDIINLSLGFDYSGFSIRVAMIYQNNIFTGPNYYPQLRGYTAAYRRWDIAAKQELPWYGIEIYTDLNNINAANDMQTIQGGSPSSIANYGFTSDLGLRVKL
jgi:TonB-dependent receptor